MSKNRQVSETNNDNGKAKFYKALFFLRDTKTMKRNKKKIDAAFKINGY